VYGYAKGDQIIKTVADILLQHADPEDDFIGYVGGDDFIAIFTSDKGKKSCESVLKSFEKVIPDSYNDIDKSNNGIGSKTRNGEDCFYPVMSLSIGVLAPDSSLYFSYGDIAELATQAKRSAKNILGNSLFIKRRMMADALLLT